MDSNTKDVLMAVIALISAVVTPIVVLYVSLKQNKKLNIVEEKLDKSNEQTNGALGKLLETTKELANAEGRKELKEEQKVKKKP